MRIWLFLIVVLFACVAPADELTRTVQEQLQAQGAYSGPLDGKPGAELTKALKGYQQRHNLPATGAIDRATAKALDDDNGMALPNVAPTPPAQPAQQNSLPAARTPPPSSSPAGRPAESPHSSVETPDTTTPPPTKISPIIAPSIPATPVPTVPGLTAPVTTPTAPAGSSPAPATSAGTPATEPPGPTTLPPTVPPAAASPTPPQELPPQFTVARETKFLRDFLHAGEGKYVTPQLRYFNFPVDYFGHGVVNYQFVRSDTLRYMRRWPRRRYLLTEEVKVAPVDNETATVDFTIAFSVQAGKRRASGRTYIRATLRESDGKLKIVAIKEQRLHD